MSMENQSLLLRSVSFVYKNNEQNNLLFGKGYTTFGGLFVPASFGISKKPRAYLDLFLSMSVSHEIFLHYKNKSTDYRFVQVCLTDLV